MSDEQIRKWADEAEAGYDVAELKRRGRGRPGRGAEPAQVVAVRLTTEELAALDAAAQRHHLSRSEAIRAALAHAPSGKFTANAAWLALASMAFNLTRAAARLASTTLGKARTATVRRTLIQVAGRVANTARRWRLHLPTRWPWQHELDQLYTAALGPPAVAAS